jgi:hypothetical protein
MSDLRPSDQISNSRPVNQRQYSTRYSSVLGRASVPEHNGFFKTLARQTSLSSALGYDPKGQSNFLAIKPIPKSFEGLNVIAHFLRRYGDKTYNDLSFISEGGKQYLKISGDDNHKHLINKQNNNYYILVKKNYSKNINNKINNIVRIKIQANNTDELKKKIAWILQNPVSRAKLDYHTPVVGAKYIQLNENKVIGNFDIQEFKNIGNPSIIEEFDSEIGSTDMHQINYHGSPISYQGYSPLQDENKPIQKVKDKFFLRVNGMNTHILSNPAVDELLGNIVNMFYAEKGISAENRRQLVQNIREDFIFNLSGKGSRNSRFHQDPKDMFDSPSKFQNFFSQLHLASDPYVGGRFWRNYNNIIPSLSQTISLMYRPTGNGDIESLYDKDPKAYIDNLEKLKIRPTDKQFIALYGRKILGIYIALKFIKHDLSQINLNHNSTDKEIKKWHDLTKIHDDLFASTGDLKNYLRHNFSGFAQVKHSVSQHSIPTIKESEGINTKQNLTKEGYQNIAEKTLYPLMLNYTQFDSFLGLHSREKGSEILYNTLKTQIFDRQISDVVVGSATVMLLEGIDKISKRLKFIDEIVGQDANLKGIVLQLGNKVQQGDIDGIYDLVARQTKRVTNMLDYEAVFPDKKFQALQAEGFMWEKEVLKPIIPEYKTRNKNIPISQYFPVFMIEKNGKILTAKLVEALKTQARLIKDIQQEMHQNNIKSPYDTEAMKKLSKYMHYAAEQIAHKFLKDHADYFHMLTPNLKEKLYQDVLKETYALQELIGNVACVLATENEAAYGSKYEYNKRNEARNQRLAKLAGEIKPKLTTHNSKNNQGGS